jgi:hypothetical protein
MRVTDMGEPLEFTTASTPATPIRALHVLHGTADNNTHREAKNNTRKSGPSNTKTLPLTATKEMFQVLALYSITKIGACEYKDIAADRYKKKCSKFWHYTAA